MSPVHPRLAAAALVIAAFSAPTASANQRHYTYTYETGTLPAGAAELETWTTVRLGREDYFARFDHRLEYEMGLLDQLQMALYINFHELAQGEPVVSDAGFDGVSLELKGKLLDPVADPLGLALYFELGGAPTELELEGKILLEKRMGEFDVALNLVYEAEFEREDDETELEAHEVEVDLAFGWFASPAWSLGVELVSRTKFEKEGEEFETEYSALFLGPTFAYNAEKYFVAATFLPQLAALAGASDGSILALESRERFEIRLLLGFEI